MALSYKWQAIIFYGRIFEYFFSNPFPHDLCHLLSILCLLDKGELERDILLHLLCQPHELKLREEELDGPHQEVHGVDVDKGVPLHKLVLHLHRHHRAVLHRGFVHLVKKILTY